VKQTVEPEKGKKLTASEVAVKTATIAVNVLQIGNKQFTYAVYDQLMEEPIIDPGTGKLSGKPWGRVNRHTDCKELTKLEVEHLHVIWQKGNELRKAIALIPWRAAKPKELPKTIACSYAQKVEDRNHLVALWLQARLLKGERIDLGPDFSPLSFDIAGHRFEADIHYSIRTAGARGIDNHTRAAFRQALMNTVGSVSVAEVERLLIQEATVVTQLVVDWEKSYKKLEQLDQFFIAV